jgi:hypothetical protein
VAKTSLEERLRLQEDIQAVARLMAAYINAANRGIMKPARGTAVAGLFAKDGTWQSGDNPAVVGHKAIRDVVALMNRVTPVAVHMTFNPDIRVVGDRATGNWHVVCLHADAQGRDGITVATYGNTFIRTAKGWKFQSLRSHPFMHGPYADGWTRLVGALKKSKRFWTQ